MGNSPATTAGKNPRENTVYVCIYIYIRAVQLIEFNYHAHLGSKSPSPAFRWSGNYYMEP